MILCNILPPRGKILCWRNIDEPIVRREAYETSYPTHQFVQQSLNPVKAFSGDMTMDHKTLWAAILPILCVLCFAPSSWSADSGLQTTTEYVPDSRSVDRGLRPRPRPDSFVEDGRLRSTWSLGLPRDTDNIDLSDLGISNMDYETFREFPALYKLDLSSNQFDSPETIVKNLQVTPMILNLSHNNIYDFSRKVSNRYQYHGLDGQLFYSKYFWSIDLSYNVLRKVTVDFDVVHFNLSHNYIACHDQIELPSEPGRESYIANLDLSYNSITCQSQFFMPSLNTLNMSYNGLEGVDVKLLRGLNALTELDLSHNNIVYIHPQAFNDNRLLQKVYLGFNKIRSIYKWVWFPTSSLEYIDLSSNQLGYLEWNNGIYAKVRSSRIKVAVNNNTNVGWSPGSTTRYSFCRNYRNADVIDDIICLEIMQQ